MNSSALVKTTAVSSIGFGVAALAAPTELAKLFGFGDESADFQLMGRMWGTRTAALGVAALRMPAGSARGALFSTIAVMNLADVVVQSTSGASDASRKQTAAVSGFFAALTALAARGEKD